MDKRNITSIIKNNAQALGFLSCGISKAEFLEEEAPRLENWLKKGMHGEMAYMEKNFDKRLDPRLLFDGAQSIISLSYNYYPEQKQQEESFKIAKYAYGKDYHNVLKKKLKLLLKSIQDLASCNGRVFVDSAPILERAWAKKSGLGWIGKNSLLISKQTGSFYFLAEIILDLPLEYDTSYKSDHCGSCTRCIDACPTQAIVAPYIIDSNKCISYLTIELKDDIPEVFKSKLDNWMFGCDVCQDVCPWNRFSKPHKDPKLSINPKLLSMKKSDWQELTSELFDNYFAGSALKRAKYSGLKKNLKKLYD